MGEMQNPSSNYRRVKPADKTETRKARDTFDAVAATVETRTHLLRLLEAPMSIAEIGSHCEGVSLNTLRRIADGEVVAAQAATIRRVLPVVRTLAMSKGAFDAVVGRGASHE
jgi:hypothetical protein